MIEKITKLWNVYALGALCFVAIVSKLVADEYGTEHQALNAIFWFAIACLAVTFALSIIQIVQIMVEARRRKALVSKDHGGMKDE